MVQLPLLVCYHFFLPNGEASPERKFQLIKLQDFSLETSHLQKRKHECGNNRDCSAQLVCFEKKEEKLKHILDDSFESVPRKSFYVMFPGK